MRKSYPRPEFYEDYGHRSPLYLDLAILVTQIASSPVLLTMKLATATGKAFLRQLHEFQKVREPTITPSLRGTPSANDIRTAYVPRSVCAALRLGSRLTDLEPSVDRSLIFELLPNGKRVIVARQPGIKGWLADHQINVPYGTVMRYKKLASRIRQACNVDTRIPLEWLLPDTPETAIRLPVHLQAAFAVSQKAVQRFLNAHSTLLSLTKAVEKKLGIIRMMTVRKARTTPHGKSKKKPRVPVQFREMANGHTVGMRPERVAATLQQIKDLYGPWINDCHGRRLHLTSSR